MRGQVFPPHRGGILISSAVNAPSSLSFVPDQTLHQLLSLLVCNRSVYAVDYHLDFNEVGPCLRRLGSPVGCASTSATWRRAFTNSSRAFCRTSIGLDAIVNHPKLTHELSLGTICLELTPGAIENRCVFDASLILIGHAQLRCVRRLRRNYSFA